MGGLDLYVDNTKKKKTKKTHHFAIERAGSWSQQAIELVQEIGRRTIVITEDSRETAFLFQRLSVSSTA